MAFSELIPRGERWAPAGALEIVLAVGLTAWTVASGALSAGVRAPLLLAMTASVAWARARPATVLAVQVLGVVVAVHQLTLAQGASFLIAAFAATFYSDRRGLVAVLLVGSSCWLLAFGDQVRIASGLAPLLLVAPVWLSGTAMRRRERRAALAREHAERIELERDHALRAERARIARELHDLVTHSVSLMVLQSGAARQIMIDDATRAREMIESVEASGRMALDELRRLLGLLSDEEGPAARSPHPGLAELAPLVEQVGSAGGGVDLLVEGEPQPLVSGVSLSAYRIVQEALTNVLKHAGGARARVVVSWSEHQLELSVHDAGPTRPSAEVDRRDGRGLEGMRRRADLYGGTVDAGPDPDGGFRVLARFPLGQAS